MPPQQTLASYDLEKIKAYLETLKIDIDIDVKVVNQLMTETTNFQLRINKYDDLNTQNPLASYLNQIEAILVTSAIQESNRSKCLNACFYALVIAGIAATIALCIATAVIGIALMMSTSLPVLGFLLFIGGVTIGVFGGIAALPSCADSLNNLSNAMGEESANFDDKIEKQSKVHTHFLTFFKGEDTTIENVEPVDGSLAMGS